MWGWKENLAVVAMLAILVAAIAYMAKMQEAAQQRWNFFSNTHHCKVVGKKDSTRSSNVTPMFNSNGTTSFGVNTVTIPAQTGWLCDDGIVYWNEYK